MLPSRKLDFKAILPSQSLEQIEEYFLVTKLVGNTMCDRADLAIALELRFPLQCLLLDIPI